MDAHRLEEMILQKNWGVTDHLETLTPSVIPVLLKLSRNPDWEVRQISLLCLGHFKTRESAEAIAKALLDPDINVRSQASGLIQETCQPAILPKLMEVLKHGEDDHVRAMAVLEIGRIGDEHAKDELKKLRIIERDRATRSNIIQALARLKDEESRKVVLNELRAPSPKTKFEAIKKIEYIHDRGMALSLEPMLNDPTIAVTLTASADKKLTIRINDAIVKAIAVIFDQPFSFRIDRLRRCSENEIQEAREFLRKIRSSIRKD
jgi:HEAT repeat protein